MLTQEQAKERLTQWQVADDEPGFAQRLQQLPAECSKPLLTLADMDEDEPAAKSDWQARVARHLAAAKQIESWDAAQRAQAFDKLAPKLAPAMEATWQLLKTVPFQIGYSRKAFRAPNHPSLSIENRQSWLTGMIRIAQSFRPSILSPTWLAAWAPYLDGVCHRSGVGYQVGPLLAAVLNESCAEADEVFEILRASLGNQHDIGAMGRHVTHALLLSNRAEGWELIENTLLAAQRQEGLRQVILETIDFSHPEAFRRMLRLILEHDLIRFSAVVRGVDVWFGQLWGAASAGTIKKMLGQLVDLLENPSARRQMLASDDAEAAFLALWCEATEDAVATVPMAEALLRSPKVELRYAAASHLVNLNLNVASTALVAALDDTDLRVALLGVPRYHATVQAKEGTGQHDDVFSRLERLLERLPAKPQALPPLVWPWTSTVVKRSEVAASLLYNLGSRRPLQLVPHLAKFETYQRRAAVERIIEARPWDLPTRAVAVELAGDPSSTVRGVALEALCKESLDQAELEQLERLLTRKTGDLRRGILAILQNQPDGLALASSRRLLSGRDAGQRMAGLELLRLMTAVGRSTADCQQIAVEYQTRVKKLSKAEQLHLAEIAKTETALATLVDCLGLINPAERTPPVAPRKRQATFITPAAVACLQALDELIHERRETSIEYESYSGRTVELLGNVGWKFPRPNESRPREKQQQYLPLAEIWTAWFAKRGKQLKDRDGLELLRASAWLHLSEGWVADQWKCWAKKSAEHQSLADLISGGQQSVQLRYGVIVAHILNWLKYLFPVDAQDALLDAVETVYAMVPAADMQRLVEPKREDRRHGYYSHEDDGNDWREAHAFKMWSEVLDAHLNSTDRKLTPEQTIRFWQLQHWRDEPFSGAPRRRVDAGLLFNAYEAGAANLTDVADHLLGLRGRGRYGGEQFDLLNALTQRRPAKFYAHWLDRHPEIRNLCDRAVDRILELELNRGDAATAATVPAYYVGALHGCETLRRLLHALGKADFKVEHYWRYGAKQDRRQTLTQLTKVTFPAEDETPEAFTQLMKTAVREGQFPEERLLQLTFLAPQWSKYVECYLGWEHMSEGVYWFLAHMRSVGGQTENAAVEDESTAKEDASAENASEADAGTDGRDGTGEKKLSAWERLILARTPLTDAERNEGAIDVAWFRRTHEQLSGRRWQMLATAARFAANPAQAKRAQFVADVLLNKIKRKDLIDGVKKKQLKEHVRLLGLLPLAAGKNRQADLIERCRVLQEYRRYANQLSGLTKPAALLAWQTGMKNLAQTAGYPDPLRLEWAVGAESVKDLAQGPLQAKVGEVTVTLSLDAMADASIQVTKGGKELKSIPPATKKDKKVTTLTARLTDLKRQSAAMRRSLEGAMCRGDTFTRDELQQWCEHALLAPLLARLVIVGEGVLGYPDKGGKALRDCHGHLEPVKAKEILRLAHPYDLLATGAWHQWQHECYQAERVQPFKQLFRELYVLTGQEKKDGKISHRYDGQQVQPTQASALFGNRGWHTGDEIFKVFHDEQFTAHVYFQSGVTTPLEVEGATLAGVVFSRQDSGRQDNGRPVTLASVPPRLFSEVMRDVDLVVSVAHAGGVDPEASASTVEMRSGLVRETCALLKLGNVRLKSHHAIIDGHLAQYSVHLGSGTVHKLPGGAICIVPVHAQHRGRLFLPFADDDPRTAEVVSKVLLLARDREIQDPIILEQLRA